MVKNVCRCLCLGSAIAVKTKMKMKKKKKKKKKILMRKRSHGKVVSYIQNPKLMSKYNPDHV